MFLYLTLVFIVMIICSTYILSSLKRQEITKINDQITNYASYVDDKVINLLGSAEKFQHGLENIFYATKNNMQCSILNSRGATIASTIFPYEKYNNQSVIKALNGIENFSYENEKDDGQIITWYNYARCSEFAPSDYIIFIRTNSAFFLDNIYKMTSTLIFALVLSLILAGAIGFLFASTLTGPIINLAKKAKEIANGNLKQKIIVNSNDEIGQLTSNFNYMAKKLDTTMRELTMENNKLEIILQNMNDGVLYFDSNGKIVHYNYFAQNAFDFKLGNINFDTFTKQMDIAKKFSDFNKADAQSFDETIIIGQKYLNLNFVPCYDKNSLIGLLIVIQDITKHKRLDDMRKEFVANVSHEIRTPLTTIKAYTETLLAGAINDKDMAQNFLTTIDNETDRVSLLAKDLLELSRFDNNQMKLEFAPLNLSEILNKSIEQNKIYLENKMQRVNFLQANETYIISGDANRINQVFSNIISNAIKYSPEKTQIEISIEQTTKYFRVYIKDHGFGIPKEDLHHIFERFYRVDKTRSRMMGGTGLGLSIAQKIMEAHNGKITVNSKINEGTTMILRFNKLKEQTDE